nr:MAG TPA: hypothetical protein [Caudoviricetes sp.]
MAVRLCTRLKNGSKKGLRIIGGLIFYACGAVIKIA